MVKNQDIPDIIVSRLPKYLRALTALRGKGTTTNSKELSEFLGYSAAQIRKDFSQFGEFGKQGTGYNIEYLSEQIRGILNLDRDWKMILVGCGNIGHAIARYSGFSDGGFHIVAAVDSSPEKIGKKMNDSIVIQDIADMKTIIHDNGIRIAMLTVPASSAQEVAENLVDCGIEAILTYAPAILNLPENIKVEYSDPIVSLQHITYYL